MKWLTVDELDALDALRAAATEGKWFCAYSAMQSLAPGSALVVTEDDEPPIATVCYMHDQEPRHGDEVWHPEARANRSLIEQLHNNSAVLSEMARAALRLREALEELLDSATSGLGIPQSEIVHGYAILAKLAELEAESE